MSKRILYIAAYDAGTKLFTYEAFIPAWDQLGRQAVTVEDPYQPSLHVWNLQTTDSSSRRLFVVDGRWEVGPE